MLGDGSARSKSSRENKDPASQAEELAVLLRLASRIANDAGMTKVAICLNLALHIIETTQRPEAQLGIRKC